MLFLSMLLSSLFTFAPAVDGDGGGSPSPDPAETPAPDPNPVDGDGGGDDGGEGDGEDKQTEVIPLDKLSKRLDRARREGASELLKALGVEDADALKALVESEKKRRDGEMTEVQKAKRDLEALAKERDTLKAQYDTLRASVREDRLMAGVTAAAPTAKHPEDVLAWARINAVEDLEALQDEDGKVDTAKAKALVNKCIKARPEYFNAETPGVPSNGGALTPGSQEQVKRAAQTAVKQAKSFL